MFKLKCVILRDEMRAMVFDGKMRFDDFDPRSNKMSYIQALPICNMGIK
jgi:hypothetical protein